MAEGETATPESGVIERNDQFTGQLMRCRLLALRGRATQRPVLGLSGHPERAASTRMTMPFDIAPGEGKV
jgi:hypothetical protein